MSSTSQPAVDNSAGRTSPLTVGNIGFMLDRLGQDCAPLQFLRELTQNSIEAIQLTPERTGDIVWDVEWSKFDLEGVYKLAIIDTGAGMTGEEMVQYINQLSSSIREQSMQGNFGVGAKIAAATRNHDGLVYLSWAGGQGSMIHLWRDPNSGVYGLRQLELPDGTYSHWAPIDDALKPDLIGDHGTMVVLLGNTSDQDTMRLPASSAAMSASRWIARYLNTRYYRFPAGIRVRAREGWEFPRDDKDRNLLRTITGQGPYLDEHAICNGVVPVTGGVIRWWILKDESALTQNSGHVASSGHSAVIYQNELYEMESGRAGVARLQQFGVFLGYNRVVLYAEPEHSPTRMLSSNTARTSLLIGGEPLPWADWAEEFRRAMPDEIRELIADAAAGSRSKDHEGTIRERLKRFKELYKLSRYKPTPTGEYALTGEPVAVGGRPAKTGRTKGTGTGRSGGSGGRTGDIYTLFMTGKEGPKGSPVDPDPFPDVMWVSAADGTRVQGFLEDRAATYIPDANQLQINGDFRVFEDMVGHYTKVYGHVPGVEDTVVEVVREWFEQTLVETVLGVNALEGSQAWTSEEIAKALSEEALSAAVMPRYHHDYAIRRALGSKLGSLTKVKAVDAAEPEA